MVMSRDCNSRYGRRVKLDAEFPSEFTIVAARNWTDVVIKNEVKTIMVSFADNNLSRTCCNAVKHFLLSTPEHVVSEWSAELANAMENEALTRLSVDDTDFSKALAANTGTTVTAVMNLPWDDERPPHIYPICFVLRMF